ncbi:MAG: hypothetical protein ABR598_05520 [Candidatus Dormibacteria bacterium]
MRRIHYAAAMCVALSLAACGAPENPMAVVRDAGQKMATVKSMKFDLTGRVKTHREYASSAGLPAGLKSLVPTDSDQKLDGTGAALLPDRFSLDGHSSQGDTTSRVHMVVIGDTVFMTIPTTGAWIKFPTGAKSGGGAGAGASLGGGIGGFDPASSEKLLKSAKSVTDLGYEDVDGVRSYHYRLFMDTDKLMAAVNAEAATSTVPGISSLADRLTISDYRVETWIGVVDHLTRRTLTDYSMSLRPASSGAQAPSGTGMDLSGMKMNMSAHALMNLHDFGAAVTITAPPNAQDFSTLFGGAAGKPPGQNSR